MVGSGFLWTSSLIVNTHEQSCKYASMHVARPSARLQHCFLGAHSEDHILAHKSGTQQSNLARTTHGLSYGALKGSCKVHTRYTGVMGQLGLPCPFLAVLSQMLDKLGEPCLIGPCRLECTGHVYNNSLYGLRSVGRT